MLRKGLIVSIWWKNVTATVREDSDGIWEMGHVANGVKMCCWREVKVREGVISYYSVGDETNKE